MLPVSNVVRTYSQLSRVMQHGMHNLLGFKALQHPVRYGGPAGLQVQGLWVGFERDMRVEVGLMLKCADARLRGRSELVHLKIIVGACGASQKG